MHILFVCDNVFLTKDGLVYSNTFSYSILKRYLDVFDKVTVIARESKVESISTTPLASGKGLDFIFLENISTLRSFFGLRKKHRKFLKNLMPGYDGVIVRVPTELGMLAAEVARRNNVKYLVEVVGCAWDTMWHYGGLKSKIYAPFFYSHMLQCVKHATYVMYVTKYFLQARYQPSNKAHILSVSDVILVNSKEKNLRERVKKIDKRGVKIIFGTIGSLSVKYKGIEVALHALSKIEDPYEYHILGEGDPFEYKKLSKKLNISDKVFFDGVLTGGEAIYSWLEILDVYLQPSLSEGLPRSVIEAMSIGCPIIASDIGGIPELLDETMLSSPGNSKQLLEKIKLLISDKQKMIEVSEQNFNRAKSYNQETLTHKRQTFLIEFRETFKV